MRKARSWWRLVALAAAFLGPAWSACGGPAPNGSEEAAMTGELRMALDAEGSRGGQYRLRAAELTIAGPSPGVFFSDDFADGESIELVLAPGSYTIELGGLWFLERLTESGSEAVEAVLTSPGVQSFEIHDRAVTRVSFRFRLGAAEGTGGAGGAGGAPGEGGEGGSPSERTEEVSVMVPEGGGSVTTDTEGDGATPADPVETTVETPVDGEVSIVEGPITQTPPPGFSFLAQQVVITAPSASTAEPLVITFRIDGSSLPPGVDETNLAVFKNGLPNCEGASDSCTPGIPACVISGWAVPDPCVADRRRVGDDVLIVVRTVSASDWNVGYALPSDRDGDGTLDGYDGCPDDPDKIAPGACGCGIPDVDSDGDGVPDCEDDCPEDPVKTEPGACGCGASDADTDSDGAHDCEDDCPTDAGKVEPGACGCGAADADTDADGVLDCEDPCPDDADDRCLEPPDADGDGVDDAADLCPATPAGAVVGARGCSVAELCPCAGPRGGRKWSSHGSYVACVKHAAQGFLRARLVTRLQAREIVRRAAQSACGNRRRPGRR